MSAYDEYDFGPNPFEQEMEAKMQAEYEASLSAAGEAQAQAEAEAEEETYYAKYPELKPYKGSPVQAATYAPTPHDITTKEKIDKQYQEWKLAQVKKDKDIAENKLSEKIDASKWYGAKPKIPKARKSEIQYKPTDSSAYFGTTGSNLKWSSLDGLYTENAPQPSNKPSMKNYFGKLKSLSNTRNRDIVGRDMMKLDTYKPYGDIIDDRNGSDMMDVRFYMPFGNTSTYRICRADFEVLPDTDPSKRSTLVAELEEKYIADLKVEYDSFLAPILEEFKEPRSSLMERNYLKNKKSFLDTGRFYVSKGVFIDEQRFMEYNLQIHGSLSELVHSSGDNDDYLMYMPCDWVHSAEYNMEDVKNWVEFLNTLGFEMSLKFMGVASIGGNKHEMYPTVNNYVDLRMSGNNPQYSYILQNDLYYKISAKGSEYALQDMHVLEMLAALYYSASKNIPGITLQIKNSIGDQITPIQTFMMACLADSGRMFQNFRGSKLSIPDVFGTANADDLVIERAGLKEDTIKLKPVTSEVNAKIAEYLVQKNYVALFKLLKS